MAMRCAFDMLVAAAHHNILSYTRSADVHYVTSTCMHAPA